VAAVESFEPGVEQGILIVLASAFGRRGGQSANHEAFASQTTRGSLSIRSGVSSRHSTNRGRLIRSSPATWHRQSTLWPARGSIPGSPTVQALSASREWVRDRRLDRCRPARETNMFSRSFFRRYARVDRSEGEAGPLPSIQKDSAGVEGTPGCTSR
jgi:hypothetical protein